MPFVGIIPNPASGKDIRRLVARALVVSNQQKVNIVSGVLVGLGATDVEKIRIMPDLYGIGAQAIHSLRRQLTGLEKQAELLELDLTSSPYDTERAADQLRLAGADVLIVLGGDGTTRIASKTAGEVPLLPVSTGTNNVVPSFVDGTIAGLCAGYLASLTPAERTKLCTRSKRIEVWVNGELADFALVDLAVSAGGFVGARAVWDASELRQIAVTRAAPTSIGLSSVLGLLAPVSVEDDFGSLAWMALNGKKAKVVRAPLGPALIEAVPVAEVSRMELDIPYEVVAERPLVLALDGERVVVLEKKDQASLVVKRNGPLLVNIEQTMQAAAAAGYFVS